MITLEPAPQLGKLITGLRNHSTFQSRLKYLNSGKSAISLLIKYFKFRGQIKDKNGSNFQVDINDDRYLSGELVGVTFNETHKQETKDKIGKKASLRVGNKNSMFGKKQTNEMKDKVRDKLSIKFFVYDIDGNFLSEEKGINEYAKSNDFNPSSIVKVLKGRYKNTSNLKFFYSFQGDKLK